MKGKKRKFRKVVWCVVLLFIALAVFLSAQFRPLMLDGAVKAVHNLALDTVNGCVGRMLEHEPTDYSDLIIITCNDSGAVTSLQANSTKINRIKSETALQVRESLSDHTIQQISVPLGILCGITLFSARGPSIPCRFTVSSMPTVRLEYHFDGAGINQTLHSIIMVVEVPLSVTLPLQSTDTVFTASFIIGETILVGEVPDSYTNVISDPEVADDIFNYGDAG